jgi:hypothetical protein
MSGLFQITVQEARGEVSASADIDRLAVVIGCASSAPTDPHLSPFYLSGDVAKNAEGYGDAVDVLTQIVEQRQQSGNSTKYPACLYAVPPGTSSGNASTGWPGSVGAIDVTGVTGTAVCTVDSSVKPFGTYEGYLLVTQGGLVGAPGILFVTSLDDGRNTSPVIALGTGSNYTIPDGNVKFVFAPSSADLTALHTLVNAIFTEFNAHVIDVTDSIHGAADTADQVNGTTYPAATNTATTIARLNALRAAYTLHRMKIAGGVHGSADATNVVTAPMAVDDSTALMLALDLKAKLNAHEVNVSVSVHGAPDNTNTVVAADPSAGSLMAGDIIRVRTKAPQPSFAAIDAAFVAISKASLQVAIVVCEFDCDAAMAAHLTTGKNVLAAVGKDIVILPRSRIPDFENDETEAAWGTSIAADFHAFTDSDIEINATYLLITDAMTTRQYLRSDHAQWAADVVRIGRADMPNVPADQPEANVTLVNRAGATIGHDEGPRGNFTGLSDESQGNRFRSVMRFADQNRLEQVFSTIPWMLYDSDERIRNLPTRRVCNAIKRVAKSQGISALGGRLRYNPATATKPAQLTYAAQLAVQAVIYHEIKAQFSNDIQNADDASLNGLVQVNPTVTVTGGNLLEIDATIAPKVYGYVRAIHLTLAVQQ